MTKRYFDWYLGSDSGNDGLTPDTPWKSYDAKRASIQAGDEVFTRRGTPQYFITANMDAKSGTSDTVRTKFGTYGEATVPYCFWYPGGAGNFIVNVSGRSYIDFSDIYFDGLGEVDYTLYMLANGATANSGHRLRRCFFTGVRVTGSGLVIGGTATSTGDTTDYLIEDCSFLRCPTHGMLVNGAHGVVIRRSKFFGNGFNAVAGGHGFSAKARRTDASSGWAQVGSTKVWYRAMASHEPDVYRVSTSANPYRRLAKNTTTPTTPAAGEFGVDSAILYINVDSTSNPSGQSVNYSWGRCYDILLEDCESYENVSDPRAPSTEGHGFAADDYTELARFLACLSRDNEGAGFSFNKGDDNILWGSVAYGNRLAALVGASCWRPTVHHNTFFGNNLAGVYNGEVVFFTYAKDGSIKNNIMKGTTLRALDFDGTCSNFPGDLNGLHGYGTAESGTGLTNTIWVDPRLDNNLRPRAPELIRAGAYLGGRDFRGKPMYNPPNIGAVDDITRTPRYAFSARRP